MEIVNWKLFQQRGLFQFLALKNTNRFLNDLICSRVVSSALLNQCLKAIHNKICFGNFHRPLVTARHMSWPIELIRRSSFGVIPVDFFPENRIDRNLLKFGGNDLL